MAAVTTYSTRHVAAKYDQNDGTHWVDITVQVFDGLTDQVIEDFRLSMFFDDPGYAKALTESINSAADFKEVEAA